MRYCIIIISFLIFLPCSGFCSWDPNPNVNLAVCDATGVQNPPLIVEDSGHGFITVWVDKRSGTETNIYAQRVNYSGSVVWVNNGVPVTRASGDQLSPAVIPDGFGGIIVFWEDYRFGDADIFGQRINRYGKPVWATNGVAICSAAGDQKVPYVAKYGLTNSFLVWEDFRSDSFGDIYAQKVAWDGSVQWATNGIVICNQPYDQWNPQICLDNSDGCFIVWEDFRNMSDTDIFAQRINGAGSILWPINGIPVFQSIGAQSDVKIVSDMSDGFIGVCSDNRFDPLGDIAAQRVDGSGTKLWGTGYTYIDTSLGFQTNIVTVSDGDGGAIVAWLDGRDIYSGDDIYAHIYAQRISSTGTKLWGAAPVKVNINPVTKKNIALINVMDHETIIAWEKWLNPFNTDIIAQKISSAGILLWNSDGVSISTAIEDQIQPVLVDDQEGGALCVWQDFRNDPIGDIYAQRIYSTGKLSSLHVLSGIPMINIQGCLLLIVIVSLVLFVSFVFNLIRTSYQ